MKILIAAAALIVALPAAANAQQAQPAHAEHGGEHKGTDHSEGHKGCCEHKNADGSPMDCCKPDKEGARPACCEKHSGKSEQEGDSGHH